MLSARSTKQNSSWTTSHNSFSTSSKHRAGKASSSKPKRSFKEQAALAEKAKRLTIVEPQTPPANSADSPIVTIAVGPRARLFACHESVLRRSFFFQTLCQTQICDDTTKRITLVDEVPEIFSSVLEYLYKGDYYPKLVHDRRRNTWTLEDTQNSQAELTHPTTLLDPRIDQIILKDTAVYCAAHKYGLDDLKKLALRKQGLQSRIQCSVILSSARFAYDNTPENDAKLRAHYLALIIRSRQTFKRSGTLQTQMEWGGKMFFDLFVAMCNHMDDISSITKSPR